MSEPQGAHPMPEIRGKRVIQLLDMYPGWCSTCDLLYSSALVDTDGRYCCERCDDHLIFNSEELIDCVAQLEAQLAAAEAKIKRLEMPVTPDEYFNRCIIGDSNKAVTVFNRIIAARAAQGEKL